MSRVDEAIKLAIEGRWEEAIEANVSIIEVSPGDIDAHNRLGKALAEIGRNGEARKAYERVLELDNRNSIARRNLERLNYLRDGERSGKEHRGIDCKLFLQDTSKARVVSLINTAPRQILAKMSAGDEVELQPSSGKLLVANPSGEYLGEVETRVGTRLVELMAGGNQYRAAISSVKAGNAKVIIRETYRHPSQLKHPSFLPKAADGLKPYIKGSLVKHDIEDDFIDELVEPGQWEGEEETFEEEGGGVEGEVMATDKAERS